MKLTTKGRYAVSALSDIAATGGEQGPVALSDIALRQGISLSYLEQLFAKLRRAGLVESVRGVSGGYALTAPAADIRVADIVAAVDEEIRTTACAAGSTVGCKGTSARCLTHDLWDELGRQIEVFLNAVTLEDIIERRVLGMAAVNAPLRESAQAENGDVKELAHETRFAGAAE
ncbi:Rrf2 family transcriptional regulator [Hyphococcus luteus]|uniref:Rrf2 family transcriptional regulator n=1 Tax=Hyphococcus luteus TaxID=2058213 RepID=A0A2S7K9T5_9PROT|nr:Rrf2 family transcriptional regulator [Marinicaulis flavus]PQA89266.1 Rrf2 family transcriptional regulator [Marinicaulis flavus]